MYRFLVVLVLCGTVFAAGSSSSPASETIGPYTIESAPMSAQVIALGGSLWGWINVTNAYVSVNDAFTGFSILDDGYANPTGVTIEMTFAPGTVINTTGTDLVVFDGRLSVNSYAISTDYDNFATELALPDTVFTDTGVDRDYYYQHSPDPNATYHADIMAAAVDLSSLGIPDGTQVLKVRVRSTSSEVDLIGVGSLHVVPEPFTVAGLVGLGAIVTVLRRRRK
ncbi:MAG: PEP-CTERM sorting domain-containing protein [Verrucomicrobia bacterium]|nr:PEP-CTERM sorting domain-containing protein [Verrucomicrobiota bacterium]